MKSFANFVQDTLTSSFKRSLRVALNPFEEVADKFALPILFSIIYLILLAMHTALQIPPKYNVSSMGENFLEI